MKTARSNSVWNKALRFLDDNATLERHYFGAIFLDLIDKKATEYLSFEGAYSYNGKGKVGATGSLFAIPVEAALPYRCTNTRTPRASDRSATHIRISLTLLCNLIIVSAALDTYSYTC